MTPHPESERLRRAIGRALAGAGGWSGDLFRFAAPRWATAAHLLTGEGAFHAGGRWHPVGAFRAVYASLDPETALAESLAHHRRYGIAVRDAMPRTLNAVSAVLRQVLNLTDGRVRQRLRLSWERIHSERWWEKAAQDEEALTQAVGRLAWEAGLEGLLVPSVARAEGSGIVLFPDRLRSGSRLEIIHPEELPDPVV